jgi:predicted Zn-ribbon and HTH transcriptional regulator
MEFINVPTILKESSEHAVDTLNNENLVIKREPSVEYLLIIPALVVEDDSNIPMPIKVKKEVNSSTIVVNIRKLSFDKNSKKLFQKVLFCKKCPRTKFFESSMRFKKHLEMEHVITCKHCGFSFKNDEIFNDHDCTPKKNMTFQCDFCPKEFPYLKGCKQHSEIHYGENKLTCKICGARLVSKRMRQHMRVSHGKSNYCCNLCPKKLKDLNQVKAHMKSHLKPWQCKICGKKFSE